MNLGKLVAPKIRGVELKFYRVDALPITPQTALKHRRINRYVSQVLGCPACNPTNSVDILKAWITVTNLFIFSIFS